MAERDWAKAFARIHDAVRQGRCRTTSSEPYAIREPIKERFGIRIIRKHLSDGRAPYHLDPPERAVLIGKRHEHIATGPFDTLADAEIAARIAFFTLQAGKVTVLEDRIRQLESQFQGFVNDRG